MITEAELLEHKWRKVNDNNFINPNVKYIITTGFDYGKNDFKSINNNFTNIIFIYTFFIFRFPRK